MVIVIVNAAGDDGAVIDRVNVLLGLFLSFLHHGGLAIDAFPQLQRAVRLDLLLKLMALLVGQQLLDMCHSFRPEGLHVLEIVPAILVMVEAVEQPKVVHVEPEVLRDLDGEDVANHHEVSPLEPLGFFVFENVCNEDFY